MRVGALFTFYDTMVFLTQFIQGTSGTKMGLILVARTWEARHGTPFA
jgi:hypothetical protein